MAYKDPKFSLYRSKDGAIVGGVCSGLSEHFKIDVTIIRILFLALRAKIQELMALKTSQ